MRSSILIDIAYIDRAYLSGRSVIFDLDDTIFPEISFLENRYKYLCKKVFSNDWEVPYEFLLNEFASHGRSSLFDKFVAHFNLPHAVEDILGIFRCYENTSDSFLMPYPWFQKLSDRLNHRFPLLIITNGNKDQQKRKIKELNLVELFPKIHCVYADEYGGKPGVEPFRALAEKVALHDPLYIGDSEVDRVFCEKCKIEFFDVKSLLV